MTIDNIRLRAEFLNTQVITRNTGKRLGVVKDILVDVDQREVVALGLRDSIISLSGMPRYMYLTSIIQTGDVILVEDEDVIDDVDVEAYSRLINSEVITETGEPLGRVRDFQFDLADGKVSSLILASLGLPQIPDQVLSTYSLPVEEIVSSGPDRLIVFEGSEERLSQLTVGVLERVGIGRPPWEREEEDMYSLPRAANPENQLGTGIPVDVPAKAPRPIEARSRVPEETWDEDAWEEQERQPLRRQQEAPLPYEEDGYEEGNWGDEPMVSYEQEAYIEPDPVEVEGDVWDDDVKSEPYNPPKVNIPEKTKIPEYEEETGY